jgi:Domain of unknown function (DUF4062)
MAKPRTFVSSTCLDLKDARSVLEEHLKSLGHEPLLSDTLTFGVTPKKHSHQACLDQVDNSDYFILLIGSRRGGTYIGSEKSITNEEYRRAMKRNIPVMTFVAEDVEHAARIFRKNPKADLSEFVDDNRIFDFVDLIRGESQDNWVRTYKTVEDIKKAITAQFAYICLLYSQVLKKPTVARESDKGIVTAMPRQFNFSEELDSKEATSLRVGLKEIHAFIARLQNASVTGKVEKLKVLWVLGRYGEIAEPGRVLIMNLEKFKQYAFGVHKAQRVFLQLSDFGVRAEIDENYGGEGPEIQLRFKDDQNGEKLYALSYYIQALLKRHEEDDALELFKRADMSVFSLD